MAEPRKNNHGSDGKLLDTWHYEYSGIAAPEPDIDEDDERPATPPKVIRKKVKVELRILKQYEGDVPPLAVKAVEFLVVCSEIGIRLKGKDIEALRAALWEKLDKKFEVKWEDYFLVRVIPESVYTGIGTGLSFSYERVEKGVAWDGTLLLRTHNYRATMIDPWPGEFTDSQGRVTACVPGTTENRKALEDFRDRIDSMREKMAEFFRPETILRTLAGLAGGASLLPALSIGAPVPKNVDMRAEILAYLDTGHRKSIELRDLLLALYPGHEAEFKEAIAAMIHEGEVAFTADRSLMLPKDIPAWEEAQATGIRRSAQFEPNVQTLDEIRATGKPISSPSSVAPRPVDMLDRMAHRFLVDLQPTPARDRSELFPDDYHHEGYVPGVDNWEEYCRKTGRDPVTGQVGIETSKEGTTP